jgi:hypothetical protein
VGHGIRIIVNLHEQGIGEGHRYLTVTNPVKVQLFLVWVALLLTLRALWTLQRCETGESILSRSLRQCLRWLVGRDSNFEECETDGQ